MLINVIVHGATTKKDLREKIKSDPSSIRLSPTDHGSPLHEAVRTTIDHIPIGHVLKIHTPKWDATISRKQNGTIVLK